MHSRIALLASTAAAALALAAPADAGNWTGWYVGVTGGANWSDDNDFAAAAAGPDLFTINTDNDTGWLVAASLGLSLGQYLEGLRVEGEVSYRENSVDGVWTSDNNVDALVSGPLSYDHSAIAVMANVWWECDLGGVSPYIGGGLGWADVEADGNFLTSPDTPAFSVSDDGFAWQAGAGVKFPISPNMKLGIGYLFFEGPEVTLLPPDLTNNQAAGELEYQNHAAVVTLTIGM
jgi:opacity protein-like surface antigen